METIEARLSWVSSERLLLGESPVWDTRDGALYGVDVVAPAVFRLAGGVITRYPFARPVASVFLSDPGHLLVATRQALVDLHLATGVQAPTGLASPPSAQERFNDGRCDSQGRLWISTMDRHLEHEIGSIVVVDPLHGSTSFATGAKLGNGVCFSPDGRWVYFSNTAKRCIVRYASNTLQEPEVRAQPFAQLDEAPGRPDGCSVDAEGCLWSARVGGGRIDRYSPDGKLIGVLKVPVSHPTHCTFGGPELRTLFVTTSRYPESSKEFLAQPIAGAVLAFDVAVQGLPEPRFQASTSGVPAPSAQR